MRNKIRTIFNSMAGQIFIMIIVVCLLISRMSRQHNEVGNDITMVSSLVGGAALLGLLAWTTFMSITRREVREMALKQRFVTYSISMLLFACSMFVTWGIVDGCIWSALLIWGAYREFRPLFQRESE